MYVLEDTFQSFDECQFNRLEIAEKIIEPIILSSDDINNIAINAPYGYGKTKFLEMAADYLQKKDFKVIFFNAWETDYIADPFLAIYTEIITDKTTEADNKDFIKNIIKSTVFGAGKILSNLLPPGLNAIANEGLDTLKNLSDIQTTQVLNEYRSLKKDIDEFKDYIKKQITEGATKPLVFIIDELDRCKPTYAIALLERIKHIFNIDNLKFIFGVDKQQLAFAIESMYGKGMDSDGYLRRFFDLEYTLPKPDYAKLLEAKINNINFDRFKDNIHLKLFLIELLHLLDFSIRDFEKMILRMRLLNFEQYYAKYNSEATIATRFFLMILKIKKENLYNDIISRKTNGSEVIKFIDIYPYQENIGRYTSEVRFFIHGYLDFEYNDPNNNGNGSNIKHPFFKEENLSSPVTRQEVHNEVRNIIKAIELVGELNN